MAPGRALWPRSSAIQAESVSVEPPSSKGVLHPLPHFAWEHFTWSRFLNHKVLLVTLGLIWSYLKSLLDWSAPHWRPQLKAYFTSSWDKLDLDAAVPHFRAAKVAKTFGTRGPRLTEIRVEGPLSQLLGRNWIYKQGRFMGETNCSIRAFTVAPAWEKGERGKVWNCTFFKCLLLCKKQKFTFPHLE